MQDKPAVRRAFFLQKMHALLREVIPQTEKGECIND